MRQDETRLRVRRVNVNIKQKQKKQKMKLARIKSVVVTEALKSRNFFSLSCYLDSFTKTPEGHLISPFHEDLQIWDLEACLTDYCCNEPESRELYNLAEKLIGKRTIDLQILKEVVI